MDTKVQFKGLAINDEEFSDESMQLISEWQEYYGDLYLKSDESKNLSDKEREEAPFILSCFCDFCYSYYLEKPGQWTSEGARDVCLNIMPRKVSAGTNFYKAVAPVLTSFIKWAEENNVVKNTKEMRKVINSLGKSIVERAEDPKSWGMAKSFMMPAIDMGIDISDQKKLEELAFLSNELNKQAKKKRTIRIDTTDTPHTLDEALESLQEYDGYFPKAALEIVIANPKEATPYLLKSIEQIKDDAVTKNDSYMLPNYAVFLLAQFKEKKAFQAILNILKLPDDLAYDILGDTVNGYGMANIIASTFDGNIKAIYEVIENPSYDQYCRCTALNSLLALYATGQLERQVIIDYFKSLFNDILPLDNSYVWASLVCSTLDIYGEELFDNVREAFSRKLVDERVVGLSCLERTINDGEKKTKQREIYDKYHFIEDTIKEISWWACFYEEEGDFIDNSLNCDNKLMENEYSHNQPYTRSMPKVGRNDPCPCGSGKKFKKCCLH